MTPTPTPQQIIELAREATAPEWFDDGAPGWHMGLDLKKFATLLLERFGQAPAVQQEPVATVSAAAYDRLQALVDSQAARIIELENMANAAQPAAFIQHSRSPEDGYEQELVWHKDEELDGGLHEYTSLYTHPAPAEVREPLTREQVQRMWREFSPLIGGIFRLVAAVEKHHGITGSTE